jgi:hypothetical protein
MEVVVCLFVFQFLVQLALQHSPHRGPSLFWTIYNLTDITPGDSPQALWQAQYLLHGLDRVAGFELFSLFDRPFFAGLVTLTPLCSAGLCPGIQFDAHGPEVQAAYASLWVVLNSVVVFALLVMLRAFLSARRSLLLLILFVSGPFVMFNTIGLWPKLFALYVLVCAVVLAVERRTIMAIGCAAIAFFVHGSFLWIHLAFGLTMTVLLWVWRTPGMPSQTWRRMMASLAMTCAPPFIWFCIGVLADAANPLRDYYLYNVSTTAGLTTSPEEIRSAFYENTHLVNLFVVGVVNLLKAMLPLGLIDVVTDFSLVGSKATLYVLGHKWYEVVRDRPFYAFGVVMAIVAFLGGVRTWKRYTLAPAVVLVVGLVPLVPAAMIYRRDDHFITAVMMFVIIVPAMFSALAVRGLSVRGLAYVSCLVLGEHTLVYLTRFRHVEYAGEVVSWYPGVVLGLVACTAAIVVVLLRWETQAAVRTGDNRETEPQLGGVREDGLTRWRAEIPENARGLIRIGYVVSIVGFVFAPIAVNTLVFGEEKAAYGENAKLSVWSDIEFERNGGGQIGLERQMTVGGEERRAIWFNSGQRLVFEGIRVAKGSRFLSHVAVVPHYVEHEEFGPVEFIVSVRTKWGSHEMGRLEIDPKARLEDRRWHEFTLHSGVLEAEEVDLLLSVEASVDGVWTLWSDPRIES